MTNSKKQKSEAENKIPNSKFQIPKVKSERSKVESRKSKKDKKRGNLGLINPKNRY
jgi:hypothetical protein